MRISAMMNPGVLCRSLFLSVAVLALMACRFATPTPPPSDISVGALQDLLVDKSLLPPNWWANAPPEPLPYEEKPAMVTQDL